MAHADAPGRNKLSEWCLRIVNHAYFTRTIIALILINTVVIGMETYPSLNRTFHDWFHLIDRIILWIFTAEVLLKLIAARPTWRYFRDSWNLFDLAIILASHFLGGAQFVTVLRIVRILRILRTISVIPSLKKLTNALLLTLPSLGTIMLLMFLIFYIFGVIGTILYRDIAPDYFGSLHVTLLTLFQLVTLEAWASGVMAPMLEEAPYSWVYFVTFILIGTFIIFNLFIGVIVSNVEKAETDEKDEAAPALEEGDRLQREIAGLREELREIKDLLKQK